MLFADWVWLESNFVTANLNATVIKSIQNLNMQQQGFDVDVDVDGSATDIKK